MKMARLCAFCGLVILSGLGATGCPASSGALRGAGEDLESLRALTRAGNAQQAYEDFDQVIKADPDNLEAHRGLVEAAYYAGRLDFVSQRYRDLAADEQRRGLGHYGLALVAVARGPGHMQPALEHFRAAAEALPSEPDLPYRIGLVLLMDGQLASAREAFEKALAADPRRPAVRVALGRCLAELGQGKQAIEVMRPILTENLNSAEAEKAQAVASQVFDPQRGLPVELSAEIHKATDLLEQDAAQPALAIVKDLAIRFPEAAFAHLLQGLAHSRLGNSGEAVVAFERALAIQPDSPLALVGLGDIYLRLERWSEARGYYERSIGLDPFYLEAYQRLREMAMRLGDLDRAVRLSQTLVRLQPNQVQPLHDHAQVLVQAGQLQPAVGAYRSILKLDEDNLVGLLRLARLHLVLGEQDPSVRKRHRGQARELLDKAQELAPDNESVQELLAGLED